jgi:hypothetical protein
VFIAETLIIGISNVHKSTAHESWRLARISVKAMLTFVEFYFLDTSHFLEEDGLVILSDVGR